MPSRHGNRHRSSKSYLDQSPISRSLPKESWRLHHFFQTTPNPCQSQCPQAFLQVPPSQIRLSLRYYPFDIVCGLPHRPWDGCNRGSSAHMHTSYRRIHSHQYPRTLTHSPEKRNWGYPLSRKNRNARKYPLE